LHPTYRNSMGRMPMSLSSLLLCCFSLSEGAYNENCEGCPANTEHFASWTQDEVGFQGLELLQTSSTLVKTVSANKAAEKGVSKFEEDESEEEEEEQEESEEEPCPLPQNAVWCTAKSGDKRWTMALYEDFEDNFVSTRVCESGFWEFPTLESMGLPRMHKEMVLLDIGANIGWYTFMFAAHGHKVLAVEPMTKNRKLMKATLCMNPDLAPRVKIFATALTNVAASGQTCNILSCPFNAGDGVLACSDYDRIALGNDCYYSIREQVPLMTLDALLAEQAQDFGDRVDMIKVDVEGEECNVVQGAQDFFSRFRPQYMMIEARLSNADHHGTTFDCVVGEVASHDAYGAYTMRPGNFSGPRWTADEFHTRLNDTLDIFFKLGPQKRFTLA